MYSKVINLGVKISMSAVLALFLVGCGGEKTTAEPQKPQAEVVVETKTAVVKTEKISVEEPVKIEKTLSQAPVRIEKTVAPALVKSAKDIYQTCVSCHGINAEKAALNKSQIIQGWDAKKIADALNGYKAGTYGAAMKGVMIGQASKLSEEEIQLVSEYISKL